MSSRQGRAAPKLRKGKRGRGEDAEDNVDEAGPEQEEAVVKRSKTKKQAKEGNVAQSPNDGVVVVLSIEEDQAIVTLQNSASKRSKCRCVVFLVRF